MPKADKCYAIVGTGAIGGFYGAKLQQSGLDVHFLLHSDYDYVRRHGLVVESPQGNIILPQVKAYQNAKDMPKCDVVMVALKTTRNHILPEILPFLLKDNGVVLLLQNGFGVEEEISKISGNAKVIGGMCFICSNKIGAGYIRHLDYSMISLGEYAPNYQPAGITPNMKEIAADFEAAGIPIELSEDLLLARWKKLVWNIPYNGLSVVLDARTDEMMNDPDIRFLTEELMQEVVAGAKAYQRIIPESFMEKMLDHTAKMTPYRTSMKIDYDEKRPLEVEAIFGTPLRKAEEAGVELPKISMLYRQLKFLDRQNRFSGKDNIQKG
ncbi:putative 2-dehydropantoate 2-reductase [Ancylothrix sp. C2]|nr:putative 2-dehydropantoate 2-reductase [Ancylothrix sp. D3o]